MKARLRGMTIVDGFLVLRLKFKYIETIVGVKIKQEAPESVLWIPLHNDESAIIENLTPYFDEIVSVKIQDIE